MISQWKRKSRRSFDIIKKFRYNTFLLVILYFFKIQFQILENLPNNGMDLLLLTTLAKIMIPYIYKKY